MSHGTAPRVYRSRWKDRFNTPTPQMLRNGLDAEHQSEFDRLRAYLLKLTGRQEATQWRGECWRWTIAYPRPRCTAELAIIVPNPDDLQLAAPIRRSFLRRISGRRLRRPIRDGLVLAAEPFDTSWAVWSITSAQVLEDVLDLIRLKHDYLSTLTR